MEFETLIDTCVCVYS